VKLEYFKGEQPNFGDELNAWLWPQLLPNFFSDDPRVLFIGIGSIIGNVYPTDAKKVLFGAGYSPTYHTAPDVHGGDWDVFFVRGPRTARALGLPESFGIGDAAILLRALNVQFRREPRYVGFMPHWESLPRGNWETACELAGIRLIDPRAPVEQIIGEILGCEVLITEAMHGAIVADALRVPWVPVLPIDSMHRGKWLDWADSLCLQLTQHRLWPSSLSEVSIATMRRPFLSSIAAGLSRWPVSGIVGKVTTYTAARRLTVLANQDPCLSADTVIEHATFQMQEKLSQLEKKYRK
jgi:succinoglycan biosynthesis protein ExoV